MNVYVNGLNISDNVNYLVESITYKSNPPRTIVSQPLSTRPGEKFITSEWQKKMIQMTGHIFCPTVSGLRTFVDQMQQSLATESTSLQIDSDRTYTVNLTKLDIPNQYYSTSIVPFSAEFEASDPFSYGTQLTISGISLPGVTTFSGTVTISGTVFAQPLLTITPISGMQQAGDAGYSMMQIEYLTNQELVTVSGMNAGDFQYGVPVAIDYTNFQVTISGFQQPYTGVFSRWEPGIRQFTIDINVGTPNGFQWILSYQPRYYE